jgi:hypothetical protein
MARVDFTYLTTMNLKHAGDCSLLGVTPDITIYAEETYGSDGWLAQTALRLDGSVVDAVDEDHGGVTALAPLMLPEDIVKPQTGWHTMALNFSGPRHRGLVGPERVPDLVRPLSIQDKISLVKQYQLPILPPTLIGLAESYVLAEAPLIYPNLFVVCRRARLAYTLPQEAVDADNQPYDYDTLVIYTAQLYQRNQEADNGISDANNTFPDAALKRPMDCLIYADHLFIADGGEGERTSAIHVWKVAIPERDEQPEINL